MPEHPEIETDKLHETIQEKLQEHGGSFLSSVALTTAIFAAVAALSALQAGHTVNEALALKMDAARYETAASDQWAFYQAKGIKGDSIRHDATAFEHERSPSAPWPRSRAFVWCGCSRCSSASPASRFTSGHS